jgi:adenosylmethionine-8-amino-7-oxononanoate aminotransferase
MAARAHGVILRPLGDTLVINPPLSLSLEEADQVLDATRRALALLAEAP